LVKGKTRGQMGSPHTSGSSLASWPLKSQWTKARGLRRCGHGRKTASLSSPTIRLWASHLQLLYLTFLFPLCWYSGITNSEINLTWAPFKCVAQIQHLPSWMSPTASTGSRTLYNLIGTMSLFLLIRLWKPFVSCSTTTRMSR